MQYYNDIQIENTKQKRQTIRFRDVEKIDKKNSKKKKSVSLSKRRWLDYNSPNETTQF